MKNLVIVESPAKAKTIEKFLGKDYEVRSSFGHIRDLKKHGLGVEITSRSFKPDYEVESDKKKLVAELKKAVAVADQVWLASDEDREGEAIAWHLANVLGLDIANTHRIVFHEITKSAIIKALETPRTINQNLVDAQQARRILDRLVGFEVSPVLWRKVKSELSAGRVQSVAVRLIVDREREIHAYNSQRFYRVQGIFETHPLLQAEVPQRITTQEAAESFIKSCVGAHFSVQSVQEKELSRNPSAPFTTSTLQQEAARKLSFDAARTMRVAQTLYEAGQITYMRTDSVNLSEQALVNLRDVIVSAYGATYHTLRRYQTKTKGAQEAHEAIRPVDARVETIGMGTDEQRLYELIRNRALASQMSSAMVQRTTIEVGAKEVAYPFIATGEVIRFDGFLRVYLEGNDDEGNDEALALLPNLAVGEKLVLKKAVAQERYTQHPPRYTEASLVKKMEELGIGRPSTYAPTLATIVKRGYVKKDNREAQTRAIWRMTLEGGKVATDAITEKFGAERKKLFPSDIGIVVTDYLQEHFTRLLEYNFTAQVEDEFDQIASGKKDWQQMLAEFYFPFHELVVTALEQKERATEERVLGTDPITGEPVIVRLGKFGPLAQIGRTDDEKKPRYASLRADQLLETITLEEALALFSLPRIVGSYEGGDLVIGIGRFGPFVRHGSEFASLAKEDDPHTIDEARAIQLIEARRAWEKARTVRTFPEDPNLKIVKGQWNSLWVKREEDKFRLPREIDAEQISYADLLDFVANEQGKEKEKKKTRAASTTASSQRRSANSVHKPRRKKSE